MPSTKRLLHSAKRLLHSAAAFGLLLALAGPSSAYARPGRTEAIHGGAGGPQANANVGYGSLSSDGRHVVFASTAWNLVPGDTNGSEDIFVRHLDTGGIERVSVGPDGDEGLRYSEFPSISADGRYVAFSTPSELIPPEQWEGSDVFVRDLLAGTTERVSIKPDGTEPNGISYAPSISADGRYVAFISLANTLVPGDTNGVRDVFVADRATGDVERVSVASTGTQSNGAAFRTDISGNGRYVAFSTDATNLVPGDTNSSDDVIVHDRDTGQTVMASRGYTGAPGSGLSGWPGSAIGALTDDGRYVTFFSGASNLVPGDSNGVSDVFVRDLVAGVTERVSVTSAGGQVYAPSESPSVSPDGRFVTFLGLAPDLAPGDANQAYDVFVHDLVSHTTELASVPSSGAASTGGARLLPTISEGGELVAFASTASDLVPDDTNGMQDLFLRRRGPALGIGAAEITEANGSAEVSGWARFDGDLIAQAADPTGDAAPDHPFLARDLTGAGLTYRPEEGDLLVRIGTAAPPLLQQTPGLLVRLQLTVDGVLWEVRGARLDPVAGITTPVFRLYRCQPACAETARLSGWFWGAGLEIRFALPLQAIGAAPGSAITGLETASGYGEFATGMIQMADTVSLGGTTVPSHGVGLGTAAPGTPADEVIFTEPATMTDGAFRGMIGDAAGQELWARTCVGDRCSITRVLEVK